MDKRLTLKVNETFAEILKDCKQQIAKVAILFDDNGLERAEGFIQHLELDNEKPFLELPGGIKILLSSIKGVNGYFDPSYSECCPLKDPERQESKQPAKAGVGISYAVPSNND